MLRRPGRRLLRGGAPQRPPVVRRGFLLLASGLAAGVIALHAAGDPTSTTPAPDPNPPVGAAPDPYSPPAKTTPVRRAPAPVHVAPRVYTQSRVATPVHVATHSTSAPTYTPPGVTRTRVTHKAHKVARHHRRARHVVHHKPKPVILRVPPAVRSHVVAFIDRLGATVVDPAESGATGRRRAAGLALAALCIASLSLVLLAARSRRTFSS